MFALAEQLPGRVVLTTTTRIFAAQRRQASRVLQHRRTSTGKSGLARSSRVMLVVAGVEGDRAVGVPPELPYELLARPDVDWVVVEADGSRMLPVKAPAAHEPVVPVETTLLIPVVGIDALSGPIREVAHRHELVSANHRPDSRSDADSGRACSAAHVAARRNEGRPTRRTRRCADQQGGVHSAARACKRRRAAVSFAMHLRTSAS